jgi:hypothetical protein
MERAKRASYWRSVRMPITSRIMIDTGPPGTVDEDYAHKPSVIFHDGKLYHFYCAVAGKWPDEVRRVSLACSQPWA